MKKRFKNILIRNRKKNGVSILLCAVVLSITLGMLVGCSITKENTEKETIENGDAANENLGNVSKQSNPEVAQTAPMPVDNSSADNTLENTITLTFSKEGEQEQKQAVLAVGNGYSLYLPDDEKWYLSAPDL